MNRPPYVTVIGAAIIALLVAGGGTTVPQTPTDVRGVASTSAMAAPSSSGSGRTSTTNSSSGTNWDRYIHGIWLMKESGRPGEEFYSFNSKLGTVNTQYWPRGYKLNDPLDNGVAAPLRSNSYTVSGTTINIGVLGRHSFTNLAKSGSKCFTARRDGRTAVKFCRM
ncbi:hypothetical protein ACQEVB_00835 [Pseudonocardia sp. CA-107938]|uniref:hypothetical protein n=1 Tax=Pseudonocardia sp. CA-107938 TaxID=3240021 RepID=UPI003D91A8EE